MPGGFHVDLHLPALPRSATPFWELPWNRPRSAVGPLLQVATLSTKATRSSFWSARTSTFVATPPALAPKPSEVSFLLWAPAGLSQDTFIWGPGSWKSLPGARAPWRWLTACRPGAERARLWPCQGSSLVGVTLASDFWGVLGPFHFWPKAACGQHSHVPTETPVSHGDFPWRRAHPEPKVGPHVSRLQAPRTRRCCWWLCRTSVPRRQPAW